MNKYIGVRFGHLVVMKTFQPHKTKTNRHTKTVCKCDCGNTSEPWLNSLKKGETVSCGCHRKKALLEANTKHGLTGTPTHSSWLHMLSRCYNKKTKAYADYGERGIFVCEEWKGENGFSNFVCDMGIRPENTSLDRKDNNGPYSPSNCRWANRAQQARNTSRNVFITWQGETMCRSDWAKRIGITPETLTTRLKRWDIDRAMTTPNQSIRQLHTCSLADTRFTQEQFK